MIVGMALKVLSEVEVNCWASNQHEFNGVMALRQLFGTEKQYFEARFAYMSDVGIEETGNGNLTWYDARENNLYRTEYRLYYDSFMPLRKAKAGDTLLLTVDRNNVVNVIIIAKNTQLINFLASQLSKELSKEYEILTNRNDIGVIANTLKL